MIKQTGLSYIEIPWFEYKDKQYPLSAIGRYINYLEIRATAPKRDKKGCRCV
jgi:hypothetical protein